MNEKTDASGAQVPCISLLADPSFLPCIEDTVEYILRGPGRKIVNRRVYANALALQQMFWKAREHDKANASNERRQEPPERKP